MKRLRMGRTQLTHREIDLLFVWEGANINPSVSILVPTLNEEHRLKACLSSLLDQQYEGDMEILVVDGGSTDATVELAVGFGIEVLNNPHRAQSYGLNLAAENSRADILIRADAHSLYARDYVRTSVDVLMASGADVVGGPMRPVGTSPMQRAIAAAMQTPLAIGPAKFHSEAHTGEVDTVYLGAFRRTHFIHRAGYRHLPSGVAEDADMYFRWRQAGDLIYLDPAIYSEYYPRGTVKALAKQFHRYGAGKADMWSLNGTLPSMRPLAPLALVLALGVSLGLSAFGRVLPLAVVTGLWLLATGLAWFNSRSKNLRFPLVVMVMHLSYGWGLLRSGARYLLPPWSVLRTRQQTP